MKKILFLLVCFLCAACCDECVDFDFVRLRLKTADHKDFLLEHRLAIGDVSLFTVYNGDTLRANAWREENYDKDSTELVFQITHQFSKANISVNEEIKDSLKLNLKVTDSYCCTNATTIRSVEYDNKVEDYERFDVINVIIE